MISVIHHDQTMLVEPFRCEGIFPKKQNAKQDPLRSLLLHFCKSIFTPTTPHLFRKISSTPALAISSAKLLSFISFASRAHETKRCNLSKLAFCKPTVWAVRLDLG